MTEPTTLGELIRERRLARGLSLGQLATSVGRTAATVRSWERDQHAPAAQVIDRLGEVLEIDPDRMRHLMAPETPPQVDATDTESDDDAAPVPEVAMVEAEAPSVVEEPGAEVLEESESVGSDVEVEPPPEPEPHDEEEPVGELVVGDPAAETEDEPVTEVDFTPAEADELGVFQRIDPDAPPPQAADTTTPEDAMREEEPALQREERIVARPLADEPTEAIPTPIPPEPTPPRPVSGPASPKVPAATATVLGGPRTAAVAAVTLSEPPLPRFLGALRVLFDPRKRWLYWIRITLTVAVLAVLGAVLLWAVGEFFTSLGDVLDSIEPTDVIQSDLVDLDA